MSAQFKFSNSKNKNIFDQYAKSKKYLPPPGSYEGKLKAFDTAVSRPITAVSRGRR